MKKSTNAILMLVFGLMGAVYAVVGGVFLAIAARAAGGIGSIYALPGKELPFAINGVVFTALGAAFLLVTVLLLLAEKRRKAQEEELLRFGTRVTGTVTEVKADYTVRVNRRYAVIAKVRCTLPGGDVTLKSRRLWNVRPNTGDTVEVVIDPMDEKKYVMLFEGE